MNAKPNPDKPAAFITVEGADGAGKTTQLAFIESWLKQRHIDVVRTREPGGTPLGERLREIMLLAREMEIDARAELLMMFAARQQHLTELILPALDTGKWVLSDRFTDATYAYQGAGRGVDPGQIQALEDWVQGGFSPDLTVILDIDTETGVLRSHTRGEEADRFEREGMAFKQAVRAQYLDRAKRYPERIQVVDASASIESVQNAVAQVLSEFLSGR